MPLRAPLLGDTVEMFIGTWASGRAVASSTTIDTVVFPLLPGQSVAGVITAADVGMPVMIVGAGPVDPLMPDVWEVQGGTLVSVITAVHSSSSFSIADPVVTSFFNTGVRNIAVFRPAGMLLDSWRYQSSIAQATRDSWEFTTLATDDYLERFDVILDGQPVYVESTDSETGEIFGGLIDSLAIGNQPDAGGGGLAPASCAASEKPFAYVARCASWDSIPFRRRVNVALAQELTGTADEVFKRCAYINLSDEGVTVIAPVVGPSITLAMPAGARVSDLFNQICTLSSDPLTTWYWKFDAWRNVTFATKTTTTAPWQVNETAGSDDNVLVSVNSQTSHDQMTNFVQAVGAKVLLGALTTRLLGDGSTMNFATQRPMGVLPVMELNGVGQTVGIAGVDTGKQWYYNPGTPDVLQDSGGTPMAPGDSLLVFTSPAVQAAAQAINNQSLFDAAVAEGPGAQYDGTIEIQDVITSDALYAAAQQVAQQQGTKPQSVNLTTVRGGLATGQLQTIVLPDANVNGDFLITQVRMQSRDNAIYWEYVAMNGYAVSDWVTAFTAFINREKRAVAITQPGVPIAPAPDVDPVTGQNTIHAGIGSSVTFPNPVTIGSLLVLVVNRNTVLGNPPAVSDTQSNVWTQAQFGSTGGGFPNQVSLLYTFASASGTLTVTCGSAEWQAVMEFTNINSTTPVDVSGAAVGLTPPALTLSADTDLVVTGLCNVGGTVTVSGAEVLLGSRANTSQPGIAYSYEHAPPAGSFTSSLRDSGGSGASVFVSVAFKGLPATSPPTPSIEQLGNPQGTVTHSGGALTADQPVFGAGGGDIAVGTKTGDTTEVVTSDGTVTTAGVLVYDADGNATAVPIGADDEVLTADSSDPLGVAWKAGGGGGGGGGVNPIIGTAIFSATGGSISNLVVAGCVASITRISAGRFQVSLSPNQAQFAVSLTCSDDNTSAMSAYLAGSPNLNSSLSSFEFYTYGIGSVPRDCGINTVAIIKRAGSGGGGAAGTAVFDPSSGTISGLAVTGCITGVSRTAAGKYDVTLSGAPANYAVSLFTGDPTNFANALVFPYTSYSPTGFSIGIWNQSTVNYDPRLVLITVCGSVPPGSLVLLETQTAAASAELDFTNCISSAYDEYVIEVVGLVNGSNAFIGFQMSTNGGASYDTGNNYDYNGAFSYNSATGQYGANSTSAILFRNGATTLAGNGAWTGTFRLFSPGSTTLYKQMSGQLMWYDPGVGVVSAQIVGIWKNAAAMNAFRLAPDTGTFTVGTVRVYGVAK